MVLIPWFCYGTLLLRSVVAWAPGKIWVRQLTAVVEERYSAARGTSVAATDSDSSLAISEMLVIDLSCPKPVVELDVSRSVIVNVLRSLLMYEEAMCICEFL